MIRILDLPPASCRSSPDYPAAHSMDTTWFAVDAAGNVGLFDTGEPGHAPSHISDQIFVTEEEARRHGYFYYEYRSESALIDVYERRLAPEHPAHVDQLPPDIRSMAKKTRLPLTFTTAELIQPLEYTDCQFWGDGGTAYLASDGVTVHPRPGREDEYPEFVRQFRERYPELSPRYRFEGMDDGT
jgi:hypothetical protein